MDIIVIIILAAIGLVCAALIIVVSRVLPKEPEELKKVEEVSNILPGMNCGACGYPGCFAYAQALVKDKNTFFSNTCATVLQDPDMLKDLEKALDMEIDSEAMNKKALVRCTGNCDYIADYRGIRSCKAADKLAGGFKQCAYGCFGLGDCMDVCPQNAITIDIDNSVAVVDQEKCTGCGLCVKECPRNIIELVPQDSKVVFLCNYCSLRDIPGKEKCDYGCLKCRKCVKACENGAITWNKEKSIPEIDHSKCDLCRACIEVCPHDKLHVLSELPIKKKKELVKSDAK